MVSATIILAFAACDPQEEGTAATGNQGSTPVPQQSGDAVSNEPKSQTTEHAVLVRIKLSDDGFGTSAERRTLQSIADEIERAVKTSKAGEYDGDEFGGGECTLFLYGSDADKLFDVIAPVLRSHAATERSVVTKRYGAADDPSAREVTITL